MENEIPQIFIPAATPEMEESVYTDLAGMCHRSVPKSEDRIYSITFVYNGEEWTAALAKRLAVKRFLTHAREAKRHSIRTSYTIQQSFWRFWRVFPIRYVTNHRIVGNVG